MEFTINNTNETLANALEMLKKDYTDENRAFLVKALEELTETNKLGTVSAFVSLDGKELFNALAMAKSGRAYKTNAQQINVQVYNAVCYASYTLSGEKVNELTIKRTYKGININDVITAKCNHIAFGYANQKVTKEILAKVIKEVFADGIHELFSLFIDKATQIVHNAETGKEVYKNENYTHCFRFVENLLNGAKNPFENTSNGALQAQIQCIYSELINADFGKKFIKRHALRLAQAVCHSNKRLCLTTENSRTAYDLFVYLARFVNNDILLPEKDKTDLHKLIVSETLNPDIIK